MNEWLLFFYKHCCFYTVYKIKALCSKSVIVMKIKCSKTAPLFGAPWRWRWRRVELCKFQTIRPKQNNNPKTLKESETETKWREAKRLRGQSLRSVDQCRQTCENAGCREPLQGSGRPKTHPQTNLKSSATPSDFYPKGRLSYEKQKRVDSRAALWVTTETETQSWWVHVCRFNRRMEFEPVPTLLCGHEQSLDFANGRLAVWEARVQRCWRKPPQPRVQTGLWREQPRRVVERAVRKQNGTVLKPETGEKPGAGLPALRLRKSTPQTHHRSLLVLRRSAKFPKGAGPTVQTLVG